MTGHGGSPKANKGCSDMDLKEARDIIVELFEKKKKSKSKLYFNDISKALEMKPREAKKLVNKLIEDGTLEYWSSGSTTMYGLTGRGKQPAAENEE